MFSKGPSGGGKLSASPNFQNKQENLKKKGLARLARRYALHLGALLVLAAFILAAVIQPAKAGTYTVTPSNVITPATAGTVTTTTSMATDMDIDNNSNYTFLKEKIAGSKSTLDVDIIMDPVGGQLSKIFKAALTIDAHFASGYDGLNYYAKMFNGPASQDIFGPTGNLGAFSSTDGSNDTITLIETDILKAQAFYQSGSPKVKIQNARAFSGNVSNDTTQSEMAIDYLAITFYEDTNNPTAGALTPAQDSTINGTVAVTLANVLDNTSGNESGIKQVQFYRAPVSDPTNWTLIGSDSTADVNNNYSISWATNTVTDGYYNLKAVVEDNVSNQTTVSNNNVRILNADSTPPNNVAITSPASGAKVNSPTITAAAEDNIAVIKVEFYSSTNPSTPFATDSTSADGWFAVWNTSNIGTYVEGNSYEVWVKAYDSLNNATESAHFTYYIDRTSPTVQSTNPANDSIDIPSNQQVSAIFNEDLNWSTVTTSTFTLNGNTSGAVAGTVSVDAPTRTATFSPSGNLPIDTFTAQLTTGIKDTAGNSLALYSWQFTTRDTSPPVVSSINPGDGAKLKLESKEISAVASDNVAITKVEFYWQLASNPGTWVKFGEDTIVGDGWKAVLNTGSLPNEAQYDIKVLAYDAAGNTPGERIVRYTVDKTPPYVTAFAPANWSSNTSRTPTITATFSEDMEPISFIDDTTVYLTRFGSFEIINMSLSYNPLTRITSMVMPFGSLLNYNTTYTATVSTQVYDLAGNRMTVAKTWNFTTEIDLIPPKTTITEVYNPSISPVNVESGKGFSKVTYNIDQESTVHLEVFDNVGTLVYSSPEQFVPAGNGHFLIWNGRNNSGQVVTDGTYTMRIVAVDSSGNIGRAKVRTSIIVDTTSPWVRNAVAESRTKIKLTFSEPMDINSSTNKFFYTITEKDNPAVSLTINQISLVDNMSVRIETTNMQKTNKTIYALQVENVEDSQGNAINSPATIEFTGFMPHGLYTAESSYCSNCHKTHAGAGGKLISSSAVKSLCYLCHGTGGQSNYNTIFTDFGGNGAGGSIISFHPVEKMPESGIGSKISCENCHDVHAQSNPEDGKPFSKSLRSKNPISGVVANRGNGFCWGCHGSDSILPEPFGDKQTYYPADGTVHNNIDWEPSDPLNNTKIRCSKCHLSHGSTRIKLFPNSINGVALSSVGDCSCCTCHLSNPNQTNFDYNGKAIYANQTGSATNPHGNRRCVVCHDPHSSRYGKLLDRTFDIHPTAQEVTGSTYYEGDLNWSNYQTCLTSGCHESFNGLTQTSKNYNVITETYSVPTGFWSEDNWNEVSYDPRANLHDFHLNLKTYRPGNGNATCKECHRIHGSLSGENPDGTGRDGKSKLVGFPMRGPAGVEAFTYAQPTWEVIVKTETQPAAGTCNLKCHGKVHNDLKYESGSPPAPALNKDENCYTCHAGLGDTNTLDIQKYMGSYGEPSPIGILSRHITKNDTLGEAGGNGCLTECHKPHTEVETKGVMAYNTIQDELDATSWDDTNKIMSKDYKLCQNGFCHTTSPSRPDPGNPADTNIGPSITPLFSGTMHGSYERIYHDYSVASPGYGTKTDVSKYQSNCLKCHNPHGTRSDMLLHFKAGSTEPEVGGTIVFDTSVNQGNNNSVCYLCHEDKLDYSPWNHTPLYEGKLIYQQTLHGNLTLKTGDPEAGHCDSCHDPHGREDPSTGNPPTQLYSNLLLAKGTDSCYATCHNTDTPKVEIPDWTGPTGYNASAHGSASIGAADGSHGRGYCENCHSAHGNEDGTSGLPIPDLLNEKEEAGCFTYGTACHGQNAINPANGNKKIDIWTLYSANKTYKHGDITLSGRHTSSEGRVANWLPAGNRHAECEDCHNSHKARAAAATTGTNVVKPSEEGVWGINPAESWPTPAAGSIASPATWTVVENAQYEWQICSKCHSKWAYGTTSATIPDTTTWSGAATDQTDTMAEFNPNNYGHHAVVSQGKNQPVINTNFANTFVGGWGSTSTLACSDCHSSEISTDAKGTHGSNFKYILAQNTTGTGTAAVFCYNCHRRDVYADDGYTPANPTYSRWSHPDNSNHASIGNAHVSGIWCLNCHMGKVIGGSHGSNAGPGAGLKDGTYTNQPLGRRLMNGSNVTSYNTKAGNLACYAASSPLSACTKSHAGQNDATNYDY